MPAVKPGSKVLVTGANGYIAVWVVQYLLEKGYSVRSTVRSAAKGEYLLKKFESYGAKHELVVVDDFTKPGAFDEAVKGVDAIEHLASPFHLNSVEPREMYDPAIKGTIGVLESASKPGSTVKRIVVTSSCAAVYWETPDPIYLSEVNWNHASIEEVAQKGKEASAMRKYEASKTAAEKAAWEYYAKVRGSVGWELTVLNPPYVFGPLNHEFHGEKDIGASMALIYNALKGTAPAEYLRLDNAWIDVRDLADAHIRAIEIAEAGGERFIVCGGTFVLQDFVNLARKYESSIPEGIPSAATSASTVFHLRYDVSKAAKILGLNKYITKEECIKDCLADFKNKKLL